MFNMRDSRFFFLLLSVSLLIGPLPLSAIAQEIAPSLFERESGTINKNLDVSYVYLGAELSNITDIISRINDLDDQVNSPLSELKNYIEQGFLFVEYNDVVKALEYAVAVLQKKYFSQECGFDDIVNELESLIHKVVNGELTIDSAVITRHPHLRTLVINENIEMLGGSVFHKHIKTKQGIFIDGKLRVSKSALFKNDVTIQGSLSVADLVTENCIHNLCVNDLSAVDLSVSGVLSVNDAYIANATIDNITITTTVLDQIVDSLTVNTILSANDTIITNATITNLSITNCVSDLCLNNLSVVNESVSGTLSVNNEIIKNDLNFMDSAGNTYVGIQAPTNVPTSYTVSLPAVAPMANQILRANSLMPTNLDWVLQGGSVPPADSNILYVAQYGDDIVGNGSFDAPYASLAQAVSVANVLANINNPLCIFMEPGIYVENNSVGPVIITTDGISIVGASPEAVYLMPSTPTNDFLVVNGTICISHLAIESFAPLATGLSLTAGNLSLCNNVRFANFQTGVVCSGGPTQLYGFSNCVFVENGIGLSVNDSRVESIGSSFFGTASITQSAANTGVSITGAGANIVIDGGAVGKCTIGFTITDNSIVTISTTAFKFNTFDIIQNGASHLVLTGSSFELTNGNSDITLQINGAGTIAEIVGCQFNGNSNLGMPEGKSIVVSDNAYLNISSGTIKNYITGLQVGLSTDTSSTIVAASALTITNCTTDITQEGSSSLNFNAGAVSSNKIIINDPTNVKLAYFDLNNNNQLTIGSTDDIDTGLIAVNIDSINPNIEYLSSLYSTQAIGFNNPLINPTSWCIISQDKANLTAITTNRADIAGLRLVSDTGSPVGGISALRGWDINKNSSDAQLSFNYQNSDINGQVAVSEYTVMQLDGFNNQLQFPSENTRIVFDGDTNLYRSSANVLQTDDNFIVGTLTPGCVVITDPITNQLASSITTSTELSYVSDVTSSIQTQINSKVAKAGDIMTGTLQLPAGNITSPSLLFTGSTNTGLSVPAANTLSFDINGIEQMNISSSGVIIDGLGTVGVVHNSASGLLSTSLIINADITTGTITNDKLTTISSLDIQGDIVVRDNSGNFATNMITLDGTPTLPTDAVTKAYVDAAIALGIVAKAPCIVVSVTDIGSPPMGEQTIDGYTVNTGDRILLVGQTNEIYNGIWLANTTGAWTYPSDWVSGAEVGAAYILILSGTAYAGSSWLCNSPTAIIGTDPLSFSEFSLPSATAGANIGSGTGLVFANKTGVTLNFRTLSVTDSYMSITTASNSVGFSTNATDLDAPNTIVARDDSGNFSAGTITANLTGAASLNVLKAGDTMTGILTLPAGTVFAPSLEFTGSNPGTGISAVTADVLSFDISGTEQMNIDSSGITIGGNLSVNDEVINGILQISSLGAGVLHSDSLGNITSSLLVDEDIAMATITNDKLANISDMNIPGDIVVRDGSGNFSAGTIIATLMGGATLDLPLDGGIMTGTLQLPAGTSALPSLTFTGSTTAGLSASSGNLSFSTNGTERMKISSGGIISIDGFTVPGIIHNDASGNLSTSLIVNADISATANIVDTKLNTISTTGKVLNSATTATNANTGSSIVARDGSGNFSAGTITAALTGNATTATTATDFSGSLTGDVTGTQDATVVSMVGGQTAADIATGTVLANTATNSDTPNTIVYRDASGDFSAGTITASLTGNATTATTAINFSGSLIGDVTGTQDATVVSMVGGQTAADIATGTVLANTATNSDTPNTIVYRDASGDFSAGTITASLTGNATTATTAINFSGSLIGDVTGTQDATVVSMVGGQTAADIAAGTVLANTATNSDTSNTIVYRDGSGNFSAGTITATLTGNATTATTSIDFSGSLNGDVTGTQGVTVVSTVGGQSAADIAAGTVLANTATNSDTSNTIVYRDGSGNFSAGTITATLTGNATTATTSTNFSGTLTGDVTGTQGATVVSMVGGQTAANVATGTMLANTATSLNTASAIVLRDGTGSFAAQEISMNDGVMAGNLILSANPSTSTTGNIIKGANRFIHNFGTNNTFMGINAGNFAMSGSGANTGIGVSTLTANGTGAFNTAIGYQALAANTIGVDNTALGYNALAVNTTGTDNTAIGYNALTVNATGTSFNTAVGSSALAANTTGINNAAVGYQALKANTTGANNTAFGYNTLSAVTTGSTNIAIGSGAGGILTTGTGNIYINANAGSATEAATTRIGTSQTTCIIAGTVTTAKNINLTTEPSSSTAGVIQKNGVYFIHDCGVNNTFTGLGAGNLSTTSSGNSGFGYNALTAVTNGSSNTAVGYLSLSANIGGNQNTALGYCALLFNTTGVNNTALGYGALGSLSTGTNNIAIGYDAGLSLGTGSGNIYINANAATGAEANTTRIGTSQTACYIAGTITTTKNINLTTEPSTSTGGIIQKNGTSFIHDAGTNNTFMGINAGNFTTSGNGCNSALGSGALTINGTGAYNTAVGYQTLAANTIGIDNTAVGYNALLTNTTGTDNTAIGYNTLSACTTGDTNIAIGSGAGGILTTGNGNIYINANAGSSTEATTTRIGTSQTSAFMAGVSNVTVIGDAVFVNATGQLGTIASTRKVKHDINDMNDESTNILKLRPVTFFYNNDTTETKQYGLIAEEVDELFPGIVTRNKDGEIKTVLYHVLPVLLLNEMKKQQATIEQQQLVIEQQQSAIDNLTITTKNMNAAINSLQAQIQQFMKRMQAIENPA